MCEENRSGRCSKTEEEQWLSVVDYKSSSREFDLTEAYYGLAMQLITYLDVALNDAVQLVGTEMCASWGLLFTCP